MTCPHCGYVHGVQDSANKYIEGEEGEFFELSNRIQAERPCGYDKEILRVFFCPKCTKCFIEKW